MASQQAQQVASGTAPAGLTLSTALGYRAPLPLPPQPARPVEAVPHITYQRVSSPFPTELLEEWERLAVRVNAPPYLYPGWASAWWRAFHRGEPELYTLMRHGRLAALLPAIRNHDTVESATNYHTPGFGLLAENTASASALARELFATAPVHVSLTSLESTDDSLKCCTQAASDAGYRVTVRPYQRPLYLELRGSWDEYEPSLGKNLLRNLKRARRQLEQKGKLSVEITQVRQHFDELLEEAFAVEASGWKGAGHTAIASKPRTRAFYTEMGRWAASRDMLRLYFLRLDGRPLAVYFALQHRGVCHLLKGGYDPAYGHCSPGNLLMHSVIRSGFSAGLSRIELNGDAEPYKFHWAAAVREQKRFDAFAPNTRGRLAWAECNYLLPMKRRLQRGLGFRVEPES